MKCMNCYRSRRHTRYCIQKLYNKNTHRTNQISPEMQNLYHVRGNGDRPNNCPTVLFVKIWKFSTRSFTNIKGLTYIKQLIMAWILKLSINKT